MKSARKSKPCRHPLPTHSLWRLLPLILPLAGCATTGHIPPASNGCEWAKPILVSPKDVLTDETAKQILAYDETGAKLCGWKRK